MGSRYQYRGIVVVAELGLNTSSSLVYFLSTVVPSRISTVTGPDAADFR
jgi:hypothetical protein